MKKFKKIYIEITNRCNLACSFCQPSSRPPAFMTPVTFAEIMDRISGHTDYISLHVLGEALLHPDLELFLAISREYGLRVNLSTNGVLLARNQTTLLRQSALRQINISLHSFEQSGPESVLDSYLTGIFAFIAGAVPATPLFINLRMWNQNPATTQAGQNLNQLIRNRLEKQFELTGPIPEDFAPGRGIILAPQVFLSREDRFAWPHALLHDLGSNGYCRGLGDHIAILVDGTVVPCCLDAEADIPLGNILHQALPEILAGPRAVAIKEGFSRQQILEPLCRRCTYRQRFQRKISGRANGSVSRYHETGNLV